MSNRKNVVESSKSIIANTAWKQQSQDNPYQIKNFNKFAFVDPQYFDSQLSHSLHGGSASLLVIDTKAYLNSLSPEARKEYMQFMKDFVSMWCPNELVENYSLCYVVGEDIKYFHIGIFSRTDNLPWEEKDIWLDKSMVDWMKEVKAYADTLKKVAVAA